MGRELRSARLSIAVAAVLAIPAACDSFETGPNRSRVPPRVSSAPDATPDAPTLEVPSCADAGDDDTPVFRVTGCLHPIDGALLAVFGWVNATGEVQEVDYGPNNNVSPGDPAQGQGESFPVGASGRFAVPIAGEPVTWTILDQTLTVSEDTADCGEKCVHTQLAGPDSYEVDDCTEACGDGTCDPGETCDSCAADCDCSALEPLVDCVRDHGTGLSTASFGFRNDSERTGAIAPGSDNGFAPGDERRGQPSIFPPGESHQVFQVTFAESELTWTLGSSSVTVDATAPPCVDDCGECQVGICVGDLCRDSCGDGWCTEGSCASCAADCECSENDVCLPSGSCASIPRCGVEAECGTLDSFGVHLDCGECPDGEVCFLNVCRPQCSE